MWEDLVGSPTVISLATGWVAFFALVFIVIRAVASGKWIPSITYQTVVNANDKLIDAGVLKDQALLAEQNAHNETSRQLTEEQKTGEIVRKFFSDLGSVMPHE